MAKIIHENFYCRCGKCKVIFSLPGIVPDAEILRLYDWKFCPICGEMIEYEPAKQ